MNEILSPQLQNTFNLIEHIHSPYVGEEEKRWKKWIKKI